MAKAVRAEEKSLWICRSDGHRANDCKYGLSKTLGVENCFKTDAFGVSCTSASMGIQPKPFVRQSWNPNASSLLYLFAIFK